MNTENAQLPKQPQKESRWQVLARLLLETLKHNWGFKLLAMLLALILWAGLITQDPTLTREKTFTDVNINVTGTESIKRNGLIVVSDLQEVLQGATVRVDVPQAHYGDAQASAYNVRVDLSRVTQTGAQDLKVSANNSSVYGTVQEINPSSVPVVVEEYVTRYRIPVTVTTEGEAPEGYYVGAASLDPPLIAISGPKSIVDTVVRAKAVIDLSTLPAEEGVVRTAVPFYLVDRQGNKVESSLVEVTSESVLLDSLVVEQTVYAQKTIDLSDLALVSGEPAEGYEIKSISVTPSTLTVAGKRADLDALDTLFSSQTADITDAKESVVRVLRVRKPSEVVYLNPDTVTVQVEIGPIISRRAMENLKINVQNVPEGLTATLDVERGDVVIEGPQDWVRGLWTSQVRLSCDLAGLEEGEHEVPVSCVVTDSENISKNVEISPETVRVTLTRP